MQLNSKEEWLLNDLQLMKESTHLTMSHLKVKYDVLPDRIIEHKKMLNLTSTWLTLNRSYFLYIDVYVAVSYTHLTLPTTPYV